MGAKGLRRGLATASALGLGLAVVASAWAQGMFYREVAKDGRIYVFAIGSRYEAFEKSGGAELGVAVSRLGYGPGGETVVFDGEEAINLYNFKHNLPGEVFAKPKEAPKPREESSVRVGVTIFADYTYQDAPKITDSDKNSVHLSSFEVRRAYINVTGNVSDWVTYRVTPDVAARLATTTTATGLPAGASVTASTNYDGSAVIRLKYAYGQVNFDKVTTHGTWVRFGQHQTPFLAFYEDNMYRYRWQGTLFEEREGFLSSSDVGLSGRFVLPNDYGDLHVGYYNGDTYTRAEVNDQKAFQIRASLRPLPKRGVVKGLRVHVFYDHDSPVKGGSRERTIAFATFEHEHLHLGFDYLWTKDRSSVTKPEVQAEGWTLWATPRTSFGLEALIRYDHFKPNKNVDAGATRRAAPTGSSRSTPSRTATTRTR